MHGHIVLYRGPGPNWWQEFCCSWSAGLQEQSTGSIAWHYTTVFTSDVNKDFTLKAKDKDQTPKDKDQTFKAKDQDKD